MSRIRIAARVDSFLEGSSIVQSPQDDYSMDPVLSAAARRLVAKRHDAKPRKDGSYTLDLDLAEARVLFSYTDVMVVGAQDNLGGWDRDHDALAEFNSGTTLMNKLVAEFGREVVR